jgi:hypothetical protein
MGADWRERGEECPDELVRDKLAPLQATNNSTNEFEGQRWNLRFALFFRIILSPVALLTTRFIDPSSSSALVWRRGAFSTDIHWRVILFIRGGISGEGEEVIVDVCHSVGNVGRLKDLLLFA